ncbi:MAG: cbb3-type cytochrome oxidase assembly protein CcoS [Marinobacter sp.]|uniref:cbb3-type cytochrome oxidase assembly protein CcoS n=1 Tax=Marinobacter sp. TaxID=50741 RepID=UPI0035671A24
MKIVFILVPLMLILVALGLVLFSWAVKNGQYDDLDGPAHRILYDDDKDRIPDDAKQPKQETASRVKRPSGDETEDKDAGEDKKA